MACCVVDQKYRQYPWLCLTLSQSKWRASPSHPSMKFMRQMYVMRQRSARDGCAESSAVCQIVAVTFVSLLKQFSLEDSGCPEVRQVKSF